MNKCLATIPIVELFGLILTFAFKIELKRTAAEELTELFKTAKDDGGNLVDDEIE